MPALRASPGDANAGVRKAAVLALLRHVEHADARAALASATEDPDAGVRAYASGVHTTRAHASHG